MSLYAVIVRGAAMAPGAPFPGAAVPHPAAETPPEAPRCRELTKAGEPCKGRPGDDGLCAAHKET